MPVKDLNGVTVLDLDELIRPTDMAGLAKLKPSFTMFNDYGHGDFLKFKYPQVERVECIHTPGNSSGVVDGASLVLLGNKQAGSDQGLSPRACIVSCALTGTEPTIMLADPTPAAQKALKLANMTVDDIDLFELNEAFASVVLRFQNLMGVPDDKINVNGGAMGHPIGATGAMILGTVLDELERRDRNTALVTLCAGGVVRMVRLLGMQEALTLISLGKRLKADKALEKGLVHELAASEEEMAAKAKAWIKANPEAKQPWEQPGYSIPGGDPADPATQGLTYFGTVNVMVQTKGNMPAQQVIMAAVIDSARVDYDTAHTIEVGYFQRLLLDQVARNMMTTFFLQMNQMDAGALRPAGVEKTTVKKLGILGAGVMGAGIAFNAAKVGVDVVLKDISQENADRGKQYAATACDKSRRIDEAQV